MEIIEHEVTTDPHATPFFVNRVAYEEGFKSCTSDQQRYNFVKSVLDITSDPPHIYEAEKLRKCELLSINKRRLGNEYFIQNNFIKTILYYNQSIALTPPKSKELALSYANRSAVLFKIDFINESLGDIQRAFDIGYPKGLSYKLHRRRGQCFALLGKQKEAKDSLNLALTSLEESNLDCDDKIRIKSRIQEEIGDVKSAKSSKASEDTSILTQEPELSYGENPEIPGVSSALRLAYNEELGRHMVATRYIKPGDVLLKEIPFSTFVSPESRYTHCTHCLQPSPVVIPCDTCAWAMFCSETCRTSAQRVHSVECSVVPTLLAFDWQTYRHSFLILRVLASVGIPEIHQFLLDSGAEHENNPDPRTQGFTQGKYLQNFKAFYHLCRNTENRDYPNLIQHCIKAWALVHWFGDLLPDPNLFGGLFLRLFQSIDSNCNVLGTYFKGQLLDRKSYSAGISIVLCSSLFSHSCNALSNRLEVGEFHSIRAVQPIKKGSIVSISYSPVYYNHPTLVRKIACFTSWQFICHCEACQDDWPTQTMVPFYFPPPISKMFQFKALEEKYSDVQPIIYSDGHLNENQLKRTIQYMVELWKLKAYPTTTYTMVHLAIGNAFTIEGTRKFDKYLYCLEN